MTYSYTQEISQYLSLPLAGTAIATSMAGRRKDTRAAMLFGRSFETGSLAALLSFCDDAAAVLFREWSCLPETSRISLLKGR